MNESTSAGASDRRVELHTLWVSIFPRSSVRRVPDTAAVWREAFWPTAGSNSLGSFKLRWAREPMIIFWKFLSRPNSLRPTPETRTTPAFTRGQAATTVDPTTLQVVAMCLTIGKGGGYVSMCSIALGLAALLTAGAEAESQFIYAGEVFVNCTSCSCEGTSDAGPVLVLDNPSTGNRVSEHSEFACCETCAQRGHTHT